MAAVPLLGHLASSTLGAEERSLEIKTYEQVEPLLDDLQEQGMRLNLGVLDHDVRLAKFLNIYR